MNLAQGGELPKEEETHKGDYPDLGVSEEEVKLLQALHLLGIKPRLGDADAVEKLIHAFHGRPVKEELPERKTEKPSPGVYHFPKLSTFYGEEGKGEVSWPTFKYEVEALLANKCYTDEQILHGIRRALKGTAGDKLRRLGTDIKAVEVLKVLETDYGTVESKESIMRKFYSCLQKPEESVETYASRLEDLHDRAVKLGAIRGTDDKLLKEVFHAGLKKELKLMTMYQKDTFFTYSELKQALRKLEADLKSEDSPDTKKTCKAAVHTDTRSEHREKKQESKSELSEVKDMLKQINERIDSLEKDKKEGYRDDRSDWYRPSYRGRGRGYREQQQSYRGRGRGDTRSHRPIASQAFQPTCFICNEKGHIQKNCPTITSQYVCTRCHKKGHQSRECPN